MTGHGADATSVALVLGPVIDGGGHKEEGKILTIKLLVVAVATFRNNWRSIAAARVLFAFIFCSGTTSSLKIRMAETDRWACY